MALGLPWVLVYVLSPQAQKGSHSYAVKVINKHKFVTLGGRVQQMFSEVEVMDKLSHPNVININDVFNTPSYLVLVLELCVARAACVPLGRRL